MSENEILQQFHILEEEFNKATKRVLIKRPLSSKKEKIFDYIKTLCITYNNLVSFVTKHTDPCSTVLANKFSNRIVKSKAALVKCGIKLNYSFEFFNDLDLLPDPVSNNSDTDYSDANSEPTISAKTCSLPDNLNNLTVDSKFSIKIQSYQDISNTISLPENNKEIKVKTMATVEQKRTFINMCASIIRNNYDGNPLALESFIDKINLIEEIAEENLIPTLVRFVFSKLEGKARESVASTVTSINEIKNSLRNRIKPDNSKVVAGKIASIRVINGDYADFSKKVEELADSLQRSLIVEGVTQTKAHEMAVEQTVTTCRANAKTELVKSILASSSFDDPKDVVAKMIIEQSNEVAERNVLRLNTVNDNLRTNNNYNQRRINFRNNNSQNYRQNYSNTNNFRNNNFQNYRRNANQNYRGNNWRNNSNVRNSNFNNSRHFRNEVEQRNSQAQVRSLNVDCHQQETSTALEM